MEAKRILKAKQLEKQYPPLGEVMRPTVDTEQAAFYLNRQPQTLRIWASRSGCDGPLEPLRICGRLAWPVGEIRRIMEGG